MGKNNNKKQVFDFINSDQLDDLYKKNSQLLAKLSGITEEKQILETELTSALKEKAQHDLKNVLLSSTVKDLKTQVSLFARRQRDFNLQSKTLREELKKLKIETPNTSGREILVSKQQNQLVSKKLIRYMAYRKRVKKAHESLKLKIQNLENHNIELLNKINDLEKGQDANHQQIDSLVEKLKFQQEEILQEMEFAQKENSILKLNYANLQRALSQQEEGFKQSMLSFQRRYNKKDTLFKNASKEIKRNEHEISHLKNTINELQEDFEKQKQDLKDQIQDQIQNEKAMMFREKEAVIINLKKELDEKVQWIQDLENQLHHIKGRHSEKLLKQRNDLTEEISNLRAQIQNQKLEYETGETKKIEELKNEYENKIKNLNFSFERKLQHIRTEMDNDFLSERKRSEVFKSIKEKQLKELKSDLEALQKENSDYKTKYFALENSHQTTLSQLKKEIGKNQTLKNQNNNVQEMWHESQQALEKQNQQIQSLQKLNKNLSESLNSKNSAEQSSKKDIFNKNGLKFIVKKSGSETKIKSKDDAASKEEMTQTLADIHFE